MTLEPKPDNIANVAQGTFTVMICNDSPMAMAVIKAVIETEPHFQIIHTVGNGRQAIDAMQLQAADVVVMDIHMPVLNGDKACAVICKRWPSCNVLIVSATVAINMTKIFNALSNGAVDYVRSPSLPYKSGVKLTRQQLRSHGASFLNKLNLVCQFKTKTGQVMDEMSRSVAGQETELGEPSTHVSRRMPGLTARKAALIVGIGVSTGGPKTLVALLRAMAQKPTCPVIICQHIEPGFEGDFAHWLSNSIRRPVVLATDRCLLENTIYVARANKNIVLSNAGRIHLTSPPSGQLYTPNIDVLFQSMAEHYGSGACAVVLTGMGRDGSAGAKQVSTLGGSVLVQAPSTATIASMPENASEFAYEKQGATLPVLAKQIDRFCSGFPLTPTVK